MKTEKTELENVLLIKPDIFEDFRGEYVETWNRWEYPDIPWICDDISVSHRRVLRGIHSDTEAWKLIDCLYGRIYLVIVNCDKETSTYRRWVAFTLSDKNRHQVLVPPNHGVAHLVLSKLAIFHYKQSESYDIKRQTTYRYDDSRFDIWWPPNIKPILSKRDDVMVVRVEGN